MQLHLVLQGQEIALPIAYRHTLQGLIYRAFSADPAFSSALHDGGHRAQDRAFKLFTFGPLTGSYTVADRRIVFHGEVQLEIRAVLPAAMDLLERAFAPGSLILLGRNEVRVAQCRRADRRLQTGACTVSTLSPVVVYQTLPDGHTRFLSPADEGYFPALIRNARRKWQSLQGEDAPFALEIAPAPGNAGWEGHLCLDQ